MLSVSVGCHETPHRPHSLHQPHISLSLFFSVKKMDVTKHRTGCTGAKYRSWVLVNCVCCDAYYWLRLRKGTGYGFVHFWLAFCYFCCLFSVRYRCIWGPVRCFVTPKKDRIDMLQKTGYLKVMRKMGHYDVTWQITPLRLYRLTADIAVRTGPPTGISDVKKAQMHFAADGLTLPLAVGECLIFARKNRGKTYVCSWCGRHGQCGVLWHWYLYL